MKSQQNPYLLRAVDWNEVFPWLILRKCLRFGFSLRLLTCVTLNLVVCIAIFSWACSGWVRSNVQAEVAGGELAGVRLLQMGWHVQVNPLMNQIESWNDVDVDGQKIVSKTFRRCHKTPETALKMTYSQLFEQLIRQQIPSRTGEFQKNFNAEKARRGVLLTSGGNSPKSDLFWKRGVLALFIMLNFFLLQMLIARMTTVRIATGVRPSLFHAGMMAWKHIFSAVIATVLMALGVALVLAPVWLTSLLPETLTTIAAPISLLCALAGVFMILGTLLGLPLMLTALMSENSDYFDAMSRAYSYALQRPLRYGFYLLVGLFYGVIGRLAMCAITWAAVALFFCVSGKNPAEEQSLYVWFFVYMAGLLPLAFTVIYTCSLFSGIYMLLRRDVDAVEMDEVWLPKSQGVPLPELPKLKSDPRGEPN